MIDRNIPFCNIIMRLDEPTQKQIVLPDGFTSDGYRDGDDEVWARLETECGDFATYQKALDFFRKCYPTSDPVFRERFTMIRDKNGDGAASCIAWYTMRNGKAMIPSLEFLVTREDLGGLGLAQAAAAETVNRFVARGEKTAYLHTQPWSYRAIWIYHKMGFRICQKDRFWEFPNDFDQAKELLASLMPKDKYDALIAGALSDIAE